MREILFMGTLALLAACAPQSGNYTDLNLAATRQIATDASRKITALYPPASTHILLAQAVSDTFGNTLEKKLRKNGYAVQTADGLDWLVASPAAATSEPVPSASAPHSVSTKTHANTTHRAAPVLPVTQDKPVALPPVSLSMSYIVDHLTDDLYRLTIATDTHTFSRVYTIADNRVTPAGAWTLKE